ncbi:MAG: excinuclease ABC subunit UvrC [Gammaproteobacteria bacterium]|nr:excinuclease ABC subunit UvrC [Gammaproteobacteria bacterium]
MINVKNFLRTLPNKPGVYQMLSQNGQVLYVGKARSLKKRVASYFRQDVEPKTAALMAQVTEIKFIITDNENAAWLLENNLIKNLKPHYNILFKDDKSFPYLFLSKHKFPRLIIHRGPKKAQGEYFGPFPDARAVHETLYLLQKTFKLRQCSDHFFLYRTRPCIQYQIKRCEAPCVGYIDETAYQNNVKFVAQFLQGKSSIIIQEITKLMEQAAKDLDYELASYYRDQIVALRKVQQTQYIVKDRGDIDVIAGVTKHQHYCVNILFVRHGLVIGNKTYFPQGFAVSDIAEVLSTFISQHYLADEIDILPRKILVNAKLSDRAWLSKVITEKTKQRIKISDQVRGESRKLVEMAEINAEHALKNRLASAEVYYQQLLKFTAAFNLSKTPSRLECFDISHTQGEFTVGSCVVFTQTGPSKKDYRRYNIRQATAGDDYAALTESLLRRFKTKEKIPQVLIIDGGKGQLQVAESVLDQLQISNVFLLAIAKGPERKAGLEEIYLAGKKEPMHFRSDAPELHFLQQIRDEAHRFAISAHRKKLAKSRNMSVLERIAGVGKNRRALLLKYFGGLQEIQNASIEELAEVQGISKHLAEQIYRHFHS